MRGSFSVVELVREDVPEEVGEAGAGEEGGGEDDIVGDGDKDKEGLVAVVAAPPGVDEAAGIFPNKSPRLFGTRVPDGDGFMPPLRRAAFGVEGSSLVPRRLSSRREPSFGLGETVVSARSSATTSSEKRSPSARLSPFLMRLPTLQNKDKKVKNVGSLRWKGKRTF